MYQKDFATWSQKKTELQLQKPIPYFYEREVWWAAIGHNIGDEEDGKGRNFARPVLIFRKFSQNLFWGIPLSTKPHRGKYYSSFVMQGEVSTALLSHMREYDVRRLLTKMADIEISDFKAIRQSILLFLQ